MSKQDRIIALAGMFKKRVLVVFLSVFARPLLLLGAFFQLVDAILIITSGSLRGGGDTRWSFVVSATLAWALRLPLVYLFGIFLEGGVEGASIRRTMIRWAVSVAMATPCRVCRSTSWSSPRRRSPAARGNS